MSGDDRPKRSWREIDQMRDGTKSRQDREQRPRGKAAEARAEQATKEYLKEVDKIFSPSQGGAEGEQLAKAMRDAHGTPGLADACRAYREALGMPADAALLGLFLDTDETELVVAALEALLALRRSDAIEVSKGLRSQLRVLAQGFDDAVAEAAEDLIAEL